MSGPPILWPTAIEVARALVTACRLEGDDPEAVFNGERNSRGRIYAFVALAQEFPSAPRASLSRMLGYHKTASMAANVTNHPGIRWFDLSRVNAVRAALGWREMTRHEASIAPNIHHGKVEKTKMTVRFLTAARDRALSLRATDPLPGAITAMAFGDPDPRRNSK